VVGAVLIALIAGGGTLFGKAIGSQALELTKQVPEVIETIKEELRSHEWTGLLLDLSGAEEQQSGQGLSFLGKGMSLIGSTFGALGNVVIVVFIATFLAAQPQVYVEGLLSLVALKRRTRVRKVLETIGHVLERWLVGQAFLMLLVALATGAGLFFLGVPLALPLAILAGLLEFVPYFGPILAGVPAVLIAFSQGPDVAVKVIVLYVLVQSVLGYLVEPFVQHKAVYLPPAIIIFSQILLGLLVGGIGLAVATPLAAAAMVAVNMLYVEDVLGDKSAAGGLRSS
jgi:predicted PurR-regulated permease PerM